MTAGMGNGIAGQAHNDRAGQGSSK